MLSPEAIPIRFSEHQPFAWRPHSRFPLRGLWGPNSPVSVRGGKTCAAAWGGKHRSDVRREARAVNLRRTRRLTAPAPQEDGQNGGRPGRAPPRWRRPLRRRESSPLRAPPTRSRRPKMRGEGRGPDHATAWPSRHSPGTSLHARPRSPSPAAQTERNRRRRKLTRFRLSPQQTRRGSPSRPTLGSAPLARTPRGQSGLRPEASSGGAGTRNPASVLEEGQCLSPLESS